ncbi:MAG: histidine phosphatase family protein [Gemmatimonadota bacterium]
MRLPRIILARHGKPLWDSMTPIPGSALAEWVAGIDTAPIDPTYRPPAALERLARNSPAIAASPLRRSLESAALLAPGTAPLVDPLFREVWLPTAFNTKLRLPPKVWAVVARSAWYSGWSPHVESFPEARRRAATAATLLARLASVHGQVLLAGHGLMNGLIGKRLRRFGWHGPRLRPRRYWAYCVYDRPDE